MLEGRNQNFEKQRSMFNRAGRLPAYMAKWESAPEIVHHGKCDPQHLT
jgi:hypothetical protein